MARKKKPETDREFAERMARIREEALEKSKKELASADSPEYRRLGEKAGRTYEEIERCEKISEEFKADPPVLHTKHVNGISVERKYDAAVQGKIALLKKHTIAFLHATADISLFTPHAIAYGDAYILRGGRRIPLPRKLLPEGGTGMGPSNAKEPGEPGVPLEDNDVIKTTGTSCAVINDSVSSDEYGRWLMVFPDSEVTLRLSEKTTHPKPSSMDPSQVPEAIKRKSKATLISRNILKFVLGEGIFRLNLIDKNKDANPLLGLSSGKLPFEFLHSSRTYEDIIGRAHAKLANAPGMDTAIAAYNARKPNPKVCDAISAFLEIRKGAITVFGTMNSLKSRSTGKVAATLPPSVEKAGIVMPGKIAFKGSTMHADSSGARDRRVDAIVRYGFAIELYSAFLSTKGEIEQQLKKMKAEERAPRVKSAASIRDDERRKKELIEEYDYLKRAGDEEMAAAVKMQIDALDAPSGPPAGTEGQLRFSLAQCEKQIAMLRGDVNPKFPPYGS
jgi:hypothetical protein